MQKKLLTAVMLSCALGTVAACGSDEGAQSGAQSSSDCVPAHEIETVKDGVLTVAAYEAPPYIGVENGTPTGVDGEILRRVAEMNCLKAEALNLQIAAVIPAVTSGRADVAAGDWYATTSRAKEVGITDPAYPDRMSIASKQGLKTVDDLVGKRVGTLQGNIWNDQLDAAVGGGFKLYQNQQGVYTDLKNGRLDAVIDAAASAPAQLELNGIEAEVNVPPPDPRVTTTEKPALNTFPTSKSNQALVEAINDGLDEMRKSGELAKILTAGGFAPDAQKLPTPYYQLDL